MVFGSSGLSSALLTLFVLTTLGSEAIGKPRQGSIAQEAYVKASNTDPFDVFGVAVSVSGNTIVIGAPREDSAATGVNGDQSDDSERDSGATYVLTRTATAWSQQAYLKASNTDGDTFQVLGDRFGSSVAISGDTIVVGAPIENSNATGIGGDQTNNSAPNAGAAYVFTRTGSNWSQEAYLKGSNTESFDLFGRSVAISGDTIAVGATDESSDSTGINGNQGDGPYSFASGAVYVFVRDGTSWTQQAYVKASNTGESDRFGSSISLSGNTLVVGAPAERSNAVGVGGVESDNSAQNAGAAYVFERIGTSWSQQAYLKASNTEAGDSFGQTVSLDGDTIIIGAPMEESSATGVNGDQSDNGADQSGAAYVFTRSGTTWSQQAYLKASNTGDRDHFGSSVSIKADSVLVGASGESSGSPGIGGDQSDDSAGRAGAAYMFVRSGTAWSQQAYIKASGPSPTSGFGSSGAISNDLAVLGAFAEDGDGTGVNSDRSSGPASDSGAVYIFDLAFDPDLPSIGTSLCFGDGGDQLGCTNCPCMNNASVGAAGGCLNSAGDSSVVAAAGDSSVSLPTGGSTDLRFVLSGAPPGAFCILNSGDGVAPSNMANPCFGLSSGAQAVQFDGLRCAITNTRRHGGRSADSNGEVGTTNSPWGGAGGPPVGIANAGAGFVAGQTRYFQAINRDDPLLSCMRGLNTSQAVEVTFTP